MARFDIRDGDKPGEGEIVGHAQSLPTGVIEIKIDGYFTPESAAHIRIQIMAAINDATSHRRRT
jgi:hypothetical protein